MANMKNNKKTCGGCLKKYCYNKEQYDFAQVIIDDIRKKKEQSIDEWDRGYNTGLTAAIGVVREYQKNYEANYTEKITKQIIKSLRKADNGKHEK